MIFLYSNIKEWCKMGIYMKEVVKTLVIEEIVLQKEPMSITLYF